jgi:phage baseplate assembly protein W
VAILPRNRLFVGYSTLGTNSKVQQFSDLELIKRDLLNHFYTKRGERVMMPTYGCGIWDLLFDPFDDLVRDSVIDECSRVIESDSRVRLVNIVVNEFDQGLTVQMDLLYVPYDVIDTFSLEFDRRTAEMM